MTDAAYTLQETNRDRKRTAAGAYAKRNGSRTKRCSLPSDNLTPAQQRKLNGECETISLKKPMTYGELKTFRSALQYLYLLHLVRDLGARRIDLIDMLACGDYTANKLINSLPGKLPFRHGRPLASKEWLAFIGEESGTTIPQDEEPDPVAQGEELPPEVLTPSPAQEPEPEKVDPNPPQPIVIQSGNFTLRGTAADVVTTLARLIDTNQTLTYTISFTA